MQEGTHLLAVMWESAWVKGSGESKNFSAKALTKSQAMKISAKETSLPSVTIAEIGNHLKKPPG